MPIINPQQTIIQIALKDKITPQITRPKIKAIRFPLLQPRSNQQHPFSPTINPTKIAPSFQKVTTIAKILLKTLPFQIKAP